jgi:hypothetical protein
VTFQTDRTTNVCEGFHSQLNATLGRRHPTVFKVIDVVKDIDDAHERVIAQLAMGAAPKRRKRRYVQVDEALSRLRTATFGGGNIPNINRVLDYMDAAAYQLWDVRH